MPLRSVCTILCLLAVLHVNAQTPDLQMPLDLPLYLSGTFGEPRGTHFHSGLDIRTNGVTGYKVYAINDGYVSRIKVSAYGYGNALYIDHPDGTTSVYAHLSKFNSFIDSVTMAMHYQKESFELDEYLAPGTIVVNKGEVIALSGNSGGSGGPHLHFEIRDTKTQEPINPQSLGYEVKDNIPPQLNKLYLYSKGKEVVPLTSIKLTKVKNGEYHVKPDTITLPESVIGIGIHAWDKMENSTGANGVYSLKLRVDGKTVYSFSMDRISFSTSRYVLSHIDYYQKLIENNTVYRCYKLEGNQLEGIYDTVVNKGFVNVPDSGTTKVELLLSDYDKNVSTLSFYVKRGPGKLMPPVEPPETEWLYCYKPADINIEDLSISFPASCMYSTAPFRYSVTAKPLTPFSNSYEIMEPGIAVNKRFSLSIKANDSIPEYLKHNMLIIRLDEDNQPDPYTSTWQGNWLNCRPRDFGVFYIDVDTTAPGIRAQNIYNGANMSGKKSIDVKITDDLSGIASYRGTIDGHWVLFQYDAKNDDLYYEFDQHAGPGEHKLEIIVIDNIGNKAIFNCSFKR